MNNVHYGFFLEYQIANRSNREMVVKTRGGLNYIIRRSKNLVHREDRRVYVKLSNARLDGLLLDSRVARTPFDKLLLERIEEARKKAIDASLLNSGFAQDISTSIELDASLRDPETDAITSDILGISLFPNEDGIDVPALGTPDYTLRELFDDAIEASGSRSSLKYSVFVNDPANQQKTYYVNVMGKAMAVPVERSLSEASGVYVGVRIGENLPNTLFYSFDTLDASTMGMIGLYSSKVDALQGGGNTERCVAAEAKLKELSAANQKLAVDYERLNGFFLDKEEQVLELGSELAQIKQVHKQEIYHLKQSHQQELQKLQTGFEMTKVRNEMDKMLVKANTDFIRQRNSVNNWGEIAKAVGAIAGVVATGYKLYTS